jgi:hypothetical protein
VALLDARTGDVLREFAARGTADVFVHQVVWEGPDVVLATVWDVDHWAVLRLAVSGLRETVGAYGIRGAHDPDAAPVVLAGPVG